MHIKFSSNNRINQSNTAAISYGKRQDFKGQCTGTSQQKPSPAPKPQQAPKPRQSCAKPPQPEPCTPPAKKEDCRICETKVKASPILKLPFCTLYSEDILLLALILVLMNEKCDETLLLALVYIFISGLEK